MKTLALEPLLRQATVKAIDTISNKAAKAERFAEGAVGKLLQRWNKMSVSEKEQVASIVIATATAVVTTIAAVKTRGAGKPVKKAMKRAGKAVLKKMDKST